MKKLQDVILKAIAKKISWAHTAEIIGVSGRTMPKPSGASGSEIAVDENGLLVDMTNLQRGLRKLEAQRGR